ncbi:hypothetical protein M5W68_16515 [Paenibacillus larvae]|uniref:hypothetical protein n=1 Tax=Paenibacillus larvae TaxID=1464 RepID=UPI00227FC074|nr:hypothetical protein [Paenibacillus larvae]MCY9510441.1 hypothetical protein [Paenibacillus larvae]MCY9526671.1 hypothetical protein [Paenibacillus larvae]
MEIRKIGLGEEEDDEGERTILISYTIHIGNYKTVPTLLEDIRQLPGVLGLTME